eukprot:9293136-Pyramimonas_sp.AAC.1
MMAFEDTSTSKTSRGGPERAKSHLHLPGAGAARASSDQLQRFVICFTQLPRHWARLQVVGLDGHEAA